MSIVIATPCYGGMITTSGFLSAMSLQEQLLRAGIPCTWFTGDKESLIPRARMEMTRTFLRDPALKPYDFMLWIDADIEYSADDVGKLWRMGADIAVGVYAMKKPDKQWFAAWKDGALVKDLDQFKGPIEVDFAGTGFMLIKRSVLEGVYEHLKLREIRSRELVKHIKQDLPRMAADDRALLDAMLDGVAADYDGQFGTTPALYMTPIKSGQKAGERYLESEDYHFCRLAREAGYKIMMDPTVRLGHWGQYRFGTQEQAEGRVTVDAAA